MKECAGNKQPLFHAVGIMPNVVFGASEQANLIQRLVNSSIVSTVESRSKCEILSARHPFIEILIFGNDSYERLKASLFSDDFTTSDARAAATCTKLGA